ncbi:MAG: hypothetical protein OHK0046_46320 [Anaerolineae bacterium]
MTKIQAVVKTPGTRVPMTADQAASAVFVDYSADRRYSLVVTTDNQPEAWESLTQYQDENGHLVRGVVYWWVCIRKPNGHYVPMYFAHTCQEDAVDFFQMVSWPVPAQFEAYF